MRKLPAFAIAAAFGGGILLGLYAIAAGRQSSPELLLILICICMATLAAGFFLSSHNYINSAATASLAAWLELGVLAGCTAQPPLAAQYVLNRVAEGAIHLNSPLRWHG